MSVQSVETRNGIKSVFLLFLLLGEFDGYRCEDENQEVTAETVNQGQAFGSFQSNVVFENAGAQFQYIDGTESSMQTLPVILWWTPSLFPHVVSDNSPVKLQCGSEACMTTSDKSLLHDTLTRGIIFYGTELTPFDLPIPRQPWHEWALLHEESPFNNFMLSHYTFLKYFNHTSTFRRESDYPLTTQYLYSMNFLTQRKPVSLADKNTFRQSPTSYAPVLYVQSHCGVASDRDRYVEELMKHIPIDSYGSCLHNRDLPEHLRNPVESFEAEDFYRFISNYKFHIAFENAICKDYMTEKLFRCLHVGSVPIYMGSPHAEDWMPNNNSIIMVQDFKSPKDLADFIKYLDENDEKYEKYLKFKEPGGVTNQFLIKTLNEREWQVNSDDSTDFIAGFECHVCKQINIRMKREKEHYHNSSVPLLPPKFANYSHMGCPQPTVSIGEPLKVPDNTDSWYRMDWIGHFWGDLDKAYAVKNMIQTGETDPTKFEKYWTDFVRKYEKNGN